MTFAEKLDQRLSAEARKLLDYSLGVDASKPYVRTAQAVCVFKDGKPRTFMLAPPDTRVVPFLKHLGIIRQVDGGGALNVQIQEPPAPLLMWDWRGAGYLSAA